MMKRRANDVEDLPRSKQPRLVLDSYGLRRSLRLKRIHDMQAGKVQLPSPAASVETARTSGYGRRSIAEGFDITDCKEEEQKTQLISNSSFDTEYKNWVTYWVSTGAEIPPQKLFTEMASEKSSKQSSKRDRSVSRLSSTTSERYANLNANGVSIDDASLMNEAGLQLCQKLLVGERAPAKFPCYDAEHRHIVQQRAATASEAIIQRDILPTLVPSIENLDMMKLPFFNKIDLALFMDEINAEWTRSNRMGGKHPKPDYVAGLRRNAFDQETLDALLRYGTPDSPVMLSPDMCFPLVIAETKRGTIGVQEAILQAVQAAAIAVKSQIHLHWKAYGQQHAKTKELYGLPLVFSVCHNHDEVHMLAHYACFREGKLQFHYTKVGFLSLTFGGGKDQNRPNTFVENVYKICSPSHVERLTAAAKTLREQERETAKKQKSKQQEEERMSQPSTGLSFGASNMGLGDSEYNSPSMSSSQSNIFKKPRLPKKVSAEQRTEDAGELRLKELTELLEKQREQLKQQQSQLDELMGKTPK